MELFTGPGHPPTVRILRRPDGAISRLDRAVEAESTPFQNHAEATAPIVDWVTTLLMERAWQSTAPAIRELPYLSPHCYEIGRKVRQRARELCIAHLAQPEEHRAWAPASNPGNSRPHRRANRKPRPVQFNNLARQANEIVREDIVDQRCWDLANRTMNTTRRSKPAEDRLVQHHCRAPSSAATPAAHHPHGPGVLLQPPAGPGRRGERWAAVTRPGGERGPGGHQTGPGPVALLLPAGAGPDHAVAPGRSPGRPAPDEPRPWSRPTSRTRPRRWCARWRP